MWYNNWFGTKYYDMLYTKRDDTEAQFFLNNLVKFLSPAANSSFLDIGCGKGRHAVYLNSLGYDVTGLDLSAANIEHCLKSENKHLNFYKHDMRRIFRVNCYDFALNLFTSFGYFEKTHHNQLAVNAASVALKHGGTFVLDFFNSSKIVSTLCASDKKIIDGITFEISRSIENGFIVKTIKVTDGNAEKFFYEKVQALTLDDFETYFKIAGLNIEHIYGNYKLNDFNETDSDRLIIIAKKI